MTGTTTSMTKHPLGLATRVGLGVLFVLGVILAAPSGFGLFWFISYFAVGALLVVRRPGLSIGWILLLLSACFAVVTGTLDATVAQFADGTVTPLTALIAILGDKAGVVAVLPVRRPGHRLPYRAGCHGVDGARSCASL